MKNEMNKVMKMAWVFIKEYKQNRSIAMKTAYLNLKFRTEAAKNGLIAFTFIKKDGTIRNAFGSIVKADETHTLFFDEEKQEFRKFINANLKAIG